MADHCCVCLNLDDPDTLADTIVRGYAVCTAHSTLIDERGSIRAAVRTIRAQQ